MNLITEAAYTNWSSVYKLAYIAGLWPRAPNAQNDILVAHVDIFKAVLYVPFDISRGIISVIENETASSNKQLFLVEHDNFDALGDSR